MISWLSWGDRLYLPHIALTSPLYCTTKLPKLTRGYLGLCHTILITEQMYEV